MSELWVEIETIDASGNWWNLWRPACMLCITLGPVHWKDLRLVIFHRSAFNISKEFISRWPCTFTIAWILLCHPPRRPISHSCICARRLSLSSERFLHYCGFICAQFSINDDNTWACCGENFCAYQKASLYDFQKQLWNFRHRKGNWPEKQSHNERKFIANRFSIKLKI